jgi:ADP-ribosylglycohydrolase
MTPGSLPTYFGLRSSDFELRIRGALKGLACGDAIGKQTETLSRDEVVRWYPDGIRGFEGPAGALIPRYAGNRKHEWLIGETTDDTERTVAVARAILRDRAVAHETVGRELLACRKCVHPGIKSLWEFHQAGDPSRVTSDHDGCGAAVRVGPVGILYRSHRLDDIVAGAREASIPTHGGALALAAAAATAAAVSAAIDGAGPHEIVTLAQHAADRAESARTGSSETAFAPVLRAIHDDLCDWPQLNASAVAAKYFPADPLTIVPLAIALATVMDSAESAILLAANIGGDSDSVASIAGAILGARCPGTVNDDWYPVVETINDHRLMDLGEVLHALRS